MDDRIENDDGVEEIVEKLAEGNPGAITALTEVVNEVGITDFFTFALRLDLHNIYGSDIWEGFDYHCNGNADEFYTSVMDEMDELKEFLEKE
jgi:hypothetical protein